MHTPYTPNTPNTMHTLAPAGNNAVEFGVVPECLSGDPKALHKCCCTEDPLGKSSSSISRATGFCSSITGA